MGVFCRRSAVEYWLGRRIVVHLSNVSNDMKRLIQTISILALLGGVAIALYSWQAQNVANNLADQNAREQAQALGKNSWSWSVEPIPDIDRALGLAFGFGLSFLGAFGLYAQLRLPEPPAV